MDDFKGKGKVESPKGAKHKKQKKKSIYSTKRKQRRLDDYYCEDKGEGEGSNTTLRKEFEKLREDYKLLEERTTKLEKRLATRYVSNTTKLKRMRWKSSKRRKIIHSKKKISPIRLGGSTPSMSSEDLEEEAGGGIGLEREWELYGATKGIVEGINLDAKSEDGKKGTTQ